MEEGIKTYVYLHEHSRALMQSHTFRHAHYTHIVPYMYRYAHFCVRENT